MAFSEAVKREAKERAHYTCVLCRQVRGFLEVHHITPQTEGGTDTVDNAAPLCPTCHGSFGANPELRKQLRQIRDWWWSHCAAQAARPDIGAIYAGMEPYLRRIDQNYQEVKEGLKSIDELRTAVVELKSYQIQQLSSAKSLTDIMNVSSSST